MARRVCSCGHRGQFCIHACAVAQALERPLALELSARNALRGTSPCHGQGVFKAKDFDGKRSVPERAALARC